MDTPSWTRRWPSWAPLAAGVWSGVYALGQVLPRWTPPLTGRRVPRLLPLLPAWVIGAGLALYGALLVGYASLSALGIAPRVEPSAPFTSRAGITWMVLFGGLAFSGLGFGLIVPVRSYAARTRPVCAAGQSVGRP